MKNLVFILVVINTCSGQFFMPWYLNKTKELMDIDIAIVKGMTKPYSKSQIAQVIHDTYEFYCKLGDVCDMIESYDDTGFRIYDEFMHKDQIGVLKMGPHCTALDFNETVLISKYHWSEQNATEVIMNYRGILYEWNKLQKLRNTFIITTTTTTTTTTTPLPPTTNNTDRTRRSRKDLTGITRWPRSGKTRGTYKKRTTKPTQIKYKSSDSTSKDISQNNRTELIEG